MKKILLLLSFLFVGVIAFSQEVRLNISGLNASEATSDLLLKKADLTNGQSGVYSVERKVDDNSQNIADASNAKKSFSSAYLFSKYKNGNRGVKKLVNVYFSDYTKSGRKESFNVHFESVKEEH